MTTKSPGFLACVALCCLAAGMLASCATSKGSTLGTVLQAEKPKPARKQPVVPPSQSAPTDTKGLQVVTDPDSAEVWIDDTFVGLSPFTVADLGEGFHKITLRKQGYYELSTWVDFNGTTMVYQTSLQQITGFLKISATPEGSSITVNNQLVTSDLVELPVGTYDVRVRLFGYIEYKESVTITEKAVSTVSVTLSPAAFAVTSFAIPRKAVNPESPGLLGTFDGTISVTAPGTGELRIRDSSGATVYELALPEFSTWDQGFTWNAHDTAGQPLPDGTYTVSLLAHGRQSDTEATSEIAVKIDRTLKVAARSVWSGSAGLLYAPVPEVLPPGDFQLSVLAAGITAPDFSGFQAPVQIGARFGLAGGLEIDTSVGAVATSVSTPFMGSIAARWNLLSPHGAFGTGSAVQVKLAAQLLPSGSTVQPLMTDTFANFTGISVELPFQISLGPVGFLLTVGATGSLWYPYLLNADGTPQELLMAWLYLRAGIMLDTGSITAGISASTRTEPLPNGVSFLGTPVPFELGGEIHWLIPGTRLVLSAIVAGEADNPTSFYFMGGGGLGFLY